jgi:DNA processing protein
VDGAAHKGALKGGGKTVAVIGCGIDINYPSAHSDLKRLIAQNGAVVSEFAPGTRPDRANFPIRNRIIAGLSLGTVVIEAGSRSGSLITASLAAEMGRDVFAVPGSIFSPMSEGTNRLIRDGAKPVCTVIDILEEYLGLCPQSIISKTTTQAQDSESNEEPLQLSFGQSGTKMQAAKSENIKPGAGVRTGATKNGTAQNEIGANFAKTADADKEIAAAAGAEAAVTEAVVVTVTEKETAPKSPVAGGGLSEMQSKIYCLLNNTPQHVDEIALAANIELRRVLAVLTTLEIEGYAQSFPGRRYTLMK